MGVGQGVGGGVGGGVPTASSKDEGMGGEKQGRGVSKNDKV